MVEFMAYTGLRTGEVAGLEVGDLVFAPGPRCALNVCRTKQRKNGVCVVGNPKSNRSRRTVPLPPWLAARMAGYFAETHRRAGEPTAPLWPGRSAEWSVVVGGKRRQTAYDWSEPVDMGTFYRRVFRPALAAAGLPVSAPAGPATQDAPARLATRGVRLHDLRHTFAAQQITHGESPWQVSQWLGHGDLAVTMAVYADYMPEEPAVNTLPEPPRPAAPATNVVKPNPAVGE
jgi:integrase